MCVNHQKEIHLEIYLPNMPKLSFQTQKFGILMKKDFIGRP